MLPFREMEEFSNAEFNPIDNLMRNFHTTTKEKNQKKIIEASKQTKDDSHPREREMERELNCYFMLFSANASRRVASCCLTCKANYRLTYIATRA